MYINYEILRTAGQPKRWKPYGSGGSVRELGFKYFSSMLFYNKRLCADLNELTKLYNSKNNPRNSSLIYAASNVKIFILGYENFRYQCKNFFLKQKFTLLNKVYLK
jgi:hypothetical protein